MKVHRHVQPDPKAYMEAIEAGHSIEAARRIAMKAGVSSSIYNASQVHELRAALLEILQQETWGDAP